MTQSLFLYRHEKAVVRIIGRRYCFGDKLAGQSAEMLRYSPEAFNVSGLGLSFGFSLLQMM